MNDPFWKSALAVDVETTGVDPQTARIVEVGMAWYGEACALVSEAKRVNPGVPIPDEASEVHGIRCEDVALCGTWADAFPLVSALMVAARPVVGYNVLDHDAPVIEAESRRIGRMDPFAGLLVVDVLTFLLWHRREGVRGPGGKRSLKLGVVCQDAGITLDNAHNAGADAAATLALADHCIALGVIPLSAAAAAAECALLARRVRWEWERWRHYLYVDRESWDVDLGGPGDLDAAKMVDRLRLGFGKHAGRRLRDCRSYVRWCLGAFDDMPPDVVELFEAAL